MYFWRIERLKADLRTGALPARDAFAYILATLLLWTAGFLVPSEPTSLDRIAVLLTIVILVLGTYLAYRANGGAAGQDFASRYFAVGWVVGIRIIALFVLLLVLALIGYVSFYILSPEGAESASSDPAWPPILLGLAFEILFYWRLVHHIRSVAQTAPSDRRSRFRTTSSAV